MTDVCGARAGGLTRRYATRGPNAPALHRYVFHRHSLHALQSGSGTTCLYLELGICFFPYLVPNRGPFMTTCTYEYTKPIYLQQVNSPHGKVICLLHKLVPFVER